MTDASRDTTPTPVSATPEDVRDTVVEGVSEVAADAAADLPIPPGLAEQAQGAVQSVAATVERELPGVVENAQAALGTAGETIRRELPGIQEKAGAAAASAGETIQRELPGLQAAAGDAAQQAGDALGKAAGKLKGLFGR